MPPEENASQTIADPPVSGNEWDGPWGSISPVPHSVETLCIQIENQVRKPRIYYYPYRTIGKWNWNMDIPETLEIQAGGEEIIMTGTKLRRLADALNLGQLRLVQLSRPPALAEEVCILSIQIESQKTDAF